MQLKFSELELSQAVEMVVMSAFERCRALNRDSFAETKLNIAAHNMTMKIRVECDVIKQDGAA